MRKEDIVINLLVYVDAFQKGMKQSEMMHALHDAGYRRIEVRREFMSDIAIETKEIGNLSKMYNLDLFYSVPELLYDKRCLNETKLVQYFKEAMEMNCHHVKVVIGDYGDVQKQDMDIINRLCSEYAIQLTVENDQTRENGDVCKIFEFLKDCKKEGGDIGLTFDIGNWLWVREQPEESAIVLKDFVRYIHIKDVDNTEVPSAVFLNEGCIPLKKILHILPKDVPMALEYPMGIRVMDNLEKEFIKLQKIDNEIYEM